MKIAALVNDDGRTITMNKSGLLLLYEQQENKSWTEIQRQEYPLENITDAEQIRRLLREHIRILGDCRNLLVKDGRAIYRMLFEDAGYRIWRLDGPARMVLEQIAEFEQADRQQGKKLKAKTAADYHPLERDAGYYYMDISEIMSDSSIHSSDVLMPFLEKGGFKTLELDCAHMPRWLGGVLEPLRLKVREQYTDSGLMKVFITKSEPL